MSQTFSVTAEWLSLDEGDADERATYSALGIRHGDVWLSEGRDLIANSLRSRPFVAAGELAEWIVWNWWRLRWEPRSTSRPDWAFAHTMSSIGSGYVWPNITIFSDEARTVLLTRPSAEAPNAAFRYLNDYYGILPASVFFGELDRFVLSVLDRLDSEGITSSNVKRLWTDLTNERGDPQLGWTRKLEALLGAEPDESDPELLMRLTGDVAALGESGVEEIAADSTNSSKIPSAEELTSIATQVGSEQSTAAMISARPQGMGTKEAWKVGTDLAEQVRRQLGKPSEPLTNQNLTDLAGVNSALVSERSPVVTPFTFAMKKQNASRIVLGGKWEQNRRFALARIVGDELAYASSGNLHPATRADTYRQRLQRSFAAELLCPYKALEGYLAGDYSREKMEDAAEHFNVASLAVQTLLVNHGRISRDDLDRGPYTQTLRESDSSTA